MTEYTIALIGGGLIGLSAVAMMFLLGRISGISGILWGVVKSIRQPKVNNKNKNWQWWFLIGLPLGAGIAQFLWNISPTNPLPGSSVLTIAAGLLVGFGTKLGSGCTSGHGVCGISRLSFRSMTATLIFMTTGITTVFLFALLRSTL